MEALIGPSYEKYLRDSGKWDDAIHAKNSAITHLPEQYKVGPEWGKPMPAQGVGNSPSPTQQGSSPVNVTTQDLAKGELNTDQKQVTFTPYRLANGQDTVSGQMEGLLASNSPYMKAATSAADQGMNQRGLLNSSMAITAGHKAAIESAMPIATQDAGYFQNQGLQKQQGDIQTGHIDHQGRIQSGHINQQIQGNLQAISAQGQVQMGLYTHQAKLQEDMLGVQHGYEKVMEQLRADNSQDAQQMNLDWQTVQNAANRTLETSLNTATLSAQNLQSWSTLISQNQSNYMTDYFNIMRDPHIKPDAKPGMIDILNKTYESIMQNAATVYGQELTWDVGGYTEEVREEEAANEPEEYPEPQGPPNDYSQGA